MTVHVFKFIASVVGPSLLGGPFSTDRTDRTKDSNRKGPFTCSNLLLQRNLLFRRNKRENYKSPGLYSSEFMAAIKAAFSGPKDELKRGRTERDTLIREWWTNRVRERWEDSLYWICGPPNKRNTKAKPSFVPPSSCREQRQGSNNGAEEVFSSISYIMDQLNDKGWWFNGIFRRGSKLSQEDEMLLNYKWEQGVILYWVRYLKDEMG